MTSDTQTHNTAGHPFRNFVIVSALLPLSQLRSHADPLEPQGALDAGPRTLGIANHADRLQTRGRLLPESLDHLGPIGSSWE